VLLVSTQACGAWRASSNLVILPILVDECRIKCNIDVMESERWTHGGKSDAPRNLGPKFEVNYGKIKGFASNSIEFLDDGWAFKNKYGKYMRGFSSRQAALCAYQLHFGSE
jgi:hypothetical protein